MSASPIRYLSVCAGIEAATAAWHPLGWIPVAFSEIDAFPRAVLAHHYPTVPLAGDFTQLKGDEHGAIDLLVGGTPCQDFSVAGLRAGIAGDRGNLTLEFLRLAARTKPRWIVWENVPGVLSSDGGRALGAFLGGLAELGYGFAYRVLDAQYFGVAQRRARVFVVGYLGDWRRAAAVLFERESLLGHPPPRREARKDIAPTISARTNGGGGLGTDFDLDGGLIANTLSAARGAACANAADLETYIPVTMASGQANAEIVRDGSPSLTCLHEAPIVAHAFKASHFTRGKDGAPSDIVPPLSADADKGDQDILVHAFDARQSDVIQYGDKTGPLYTDGYTMAVAFDTTQITNRDNRSNPKPGDPCHPLAAGAHPPAIAFTAKDYGQDAGEISPTLRGGAHTDSHANGGVMPAVAHAAMAVRRLTPRECERLQGFPEIHRMVTVRVCFSEEERRALASCVGRPSTRLERALSEPVAAHVRIDLERQAVRLLSAGRSTCNASDAVEASAFRPLVPVADFVQVAALMTATAVPQIHGGEAASQQSISGSIPRWNGSAFVLACGRESEGFASDAARLTAEVTRCIRSTTLQRGPTSPRGDWTLATSASCVVAAIGSCIHERIQAASSFNVVIETHSGYTAVPYRGKPAADGPRYKALGNSMAVPVMAWLGQRIAMVDAIAAERAAA